MNLKIPYYYQTMVLLPQYRSTKLKIFLIISLLILFKELQEILVNFLIYHIKAIRISNHRKNWNIQIKISTKKTNQYLNQYSRLQVHIIMMKLMDL